MSLTPLRLSVLRFIVTEPIRTHQPIIAKQVAAAFGVTRSSMHETVQALIEDGYITDTDDRFGTVGKPLIPTEKGAAAVFGPDDWFRRIVEPIYIKD